MLEELIQADIVKADGTLKLELLPTLIELVLPLKLPSPSTFPAAAVVLVIVPLLAFEVESLAVNVVPFGKCHTPLKFESHTPVASCWLETAELP